MRFLFVSLLLLIPSCNKEEEPAREASLSVHVLYDQGEGIEPRLSVTLVSLKNGFPARFHTIKKRTSPEPGVAAYHALRLKPGTYRVTAGWSNYQGSEEESISGPLPSTESTIDLVPGPQRLDLEVCHSHGIYLAVKGLPQKPAESIRIRILDEEAYSCCLGLLPSIESKSRSGYFLPLFKGTGCTLKADGLVPEWEAVLPVKAASPPPWHSLSFPEITFHSLEVEVFFPSGEPVAGFMKAQHLGWNLPFMDPEKGIDLLNMGRGRRRVDLLPEGAYRLYFFWTSRKDGGEGIEEIAEVEVKSDLFKKIDFDPITVTFKTDGLPKGSYVAFIREAEGNRIVSQRGFTLPAPARPCCLLFQPGLYEGEIRSEGLCLEFSFIALAGRKSLLIDF